MKRHHILILGGTTEASNLAERLSTDPSLDITYSLAGRTEIPKPLPVPVRIGGFGGAEGLAKFLQREEVDLLVDATHPFANGISVNAAEASDRTDIPLLAIRRPAWKEQREDDWFEFWSPAKCAEMLYNIQDSRIFIAVGRQEASIYICDDSNFYLVRSIDPVDPPLDAPNVKCIHARGPFTLEEELKLLKEEEIDFMVCKNSGGTAAYAKIEAARILGIQVFIQQRREPPATAQVETVDEAMRFIDHLFSPE